VPFKFRRKWEREESETKIDFHKITIIMKKRDLRAEVWSRRWVAGRWCAADWERDARRPVGVCGESVGRESVIMRWVVDRNDCGPLFWLISSLMAASPAKIDPSRCRSCRYLRVFPTRLPTRSFYTTYSSHLMLLPDYYIIL